ncbi:hypothetical protein FB451DRAFT_1188881 [Mycena latifolia]|nr:hypothetical protein FB451DRAFT_1188881 [Mycena latifolia]
MADPERGTSPPKKVNDPNEEAAAAKLWAVYISEADKYDKALVESWKNNMEGMLIFSKSSLSSTHHCYFFGGLVAFLISVNLMMTIVAAVLLFVVGTVYAVVTLFSLRYTDSPYRTPLSGTFWRLLQTFQPWKHRHAIAEGATLVPDPSQEENMVEAMFHAATQSSEERRARVDRALIWSMKSLVDDNELEPFVGAIPDALPAPVVAFPASRLSGSSQVSAQQTSFPYTRLYPDLATDFSGCLHPLSSYQQHASQGFLDSEIASSLDSARAMMLWSTFRAHRAWVTSAPYHWKETRDMIMRDRVFGTSIPVEELEYPLTLIFLRLASLKTDPGIMTPDWSDKNISALLYLWHPDSTSVSVPSVIIQLLNGQHSDSELRHVLGHGGDILRYLWSACPETLSKGPAGRHASKLPFREAWFTALWRLAA